MKIPFVDLKRQYYSIKDKIDQAILSVIQDSAFVGGKFAMKIRYINEIAICVKNRCRYSSGYQCYGERWQDITQVFALRTGIWGKLFSQRY